jgi:hypothetical protein
VDPEGTLARSDSDLEGRAITARFFSIFFERDAYARRRFMTLGVSDEWHEASSAGSWIVALTPTEAEELAERLFALIDEYRGARLEEGRESALVSMSILPWLE